MQTKIFLFAIFALDLLVCIYGQSSAGPEPVTLPVLPTTVKTVAPAISAGAEPQGKKEVPPLGSGSSIQMSPCPAGATPLTGDGGQPRKCLPRHSEMCGNAGACCYFNQVDYFCCTGVSECPSFGNVTLVIYRGLSPAGGVGSPYESFFAQSERVNVPNFDQYPGVRGPPPAYGGSPPPPPPPPAYSTPPPPPPPPAYPSPAPATSAPVGYPAPAPQPTGGYGGNVPASNNKLCPTCMGENVAPNPGQAFIPIMPESGTMHFVMPQRNAICATCGTNQVPGGGYGSVALPLPSPSYSAVPAPAVPQPSPSYGSQALPSPSPSYGGGPSPVAPQQPNVLCPTCNVNQVKPSQPNVLCPTCNQQATLPAQIGGYNVNPPPVPLQPVVSAYGANPSPTNPQPIAPQPGYGSSVTPAIPVQPNQLCPTCSIQPNVIQPGISNPQPQTPLRYDGTGNLISSGTGNLNTAGATQNNYGASRVPSSYSAPAPAQPAPSTYSAPAPAQPAPSTYSAPAPAQPAPSTYSAPAPAQPAPSTYSAPAPIVPIQPSSSYSAPAPIVPIQPSPSYSAPAPALQPASGYGQPSSNVVNPLCPTCSLQQPPPFMPFIPIQPGSNNTGMQFVMPQPGVLCPTCNVQPTVVGSYPIPGPPSPRSYGGTISNPPPVSPYGGGQQPVVPPAVAVPSYSSLPSGFVNPNLPPDQGFGVNPNVPPDQGFNATINPPPQFPPPQKQNGTVLPVLNPPTEWKPGGGFPPSKFGARRLPVLKTLPAGENPNFLDFLRRLKDSNNESSDNEENKRNRRIRSNVWR